MGIARLFNQTVTVETYLGTGIHGPRYATPTVVPCFINDSRKLVRSSMGEQVVSSTTVYAPLDAAPTDPPVAGQFVPESRVTVNGRTAQVINAYRRDSAGPVSSFHTQAELS